MQSITTLSPDQLRPNEYNPNQMTDDEFAEVVAEVRHLGRLPKPVIVRPNGDGYIIVDGEHGWRAATECGLEAISCEIIEADDFEAMRQTFKRNQHGTHDPVKLGLMFRQMMKDKDLSKRALAKEITVSEGTVRNAIAYAEMSERYADMADSYRMKKCPITDMTVKQMRYLAMLPEEVGRYWLRTGADVKALLYEWDGKDPDSRWLEHSGVSLAEFMHGFYKARLTHIEFARSRPNFAATMKKIDEWRSWEQYGFMMRGLTPDDVRPYLSHHYKEVWSVREKDMMSAALGQITDATTKPATFILTPDEFAAEVDALKVSRRASHEDFIECLMLAVARKTGEAPKNKAGVIAQLKEAEVKADAPDYIRDSELWAGAKYDLWKMDAPEELKREAAASGNRFLPNGFDKKVQEANRTAQLAEKLDGVKIEEHAESAARWVTQRMLDNGMVIKESDDDGDVNHRAEARVEILTKVFMELNPMELMTIKEAFEHDSYIKAFKAMSGMA